MKIFVFSALGLLLGGFLFVWIMTQIRYRIGSRHVKVVLFGVPIRRLGLANIESVSKRRGAGWAEYWWSTMKPKHRVLVIRKKRGLFKNFVITPKNRYIFKTDLERATQRVAGGGRRGIGPEPEPSSDVTDVEEGTDAEQDGAEDSAIRKEG